MGKKTVYFLLLHGLALLGALLFTRQADAATYTFKSTLYNWESASTNVVWDQSCTGYPRDDDKQTVNLGFSFTFADVAYTQVRIHANGVLQFGADNGFHRQYTNSDLPVSSLPPSRSGCVNASSDRLMLIYWDDINPRLGGTVRYESKGTAPNRRFVVSWENVPHYNYGGSYTFQAILYENGEFVYQYGTGNASGASATIGVEVGNSDYTLYSYNNSYSYAGTAVRWFRPSGEPTRLAQYWMEDGTWNGTPNEVMDWSGNSHHGVQVGAAQTTASGRLCRGASIPANTSAGVIDAINTNLDVDATIGGSGSISFWYKSNLAWSGSGARDQQLFDATTQNNSWFFLTKRSGGQLRFVVSDSAGTVTAAETTANSVAAGAWKHITVTWRFLSGTNQTVLRIYIDGHFAAVAQSTTNGNLPSSLGTLYLGDNRSGVIGQSGTGNSANGIIDEVLFYNYEISGAEVESDMGAEHPCTFLNHLRLLHDGQALTCAPESVTVRACMDSSCSALYSGNVTATLTPSGWVGGDTINFSGGEIVSQLRRTTAGTVTIGANSISPTPSSQVRCFNGGSETCSLVFQEAGLFITVPDLIANKPGGPVTVMAVKADDSGLSCSPAFTGTRTVNFWSAYNDPGSGIMQVNLGGTTIGASSPGTPVSLEFDGSARASIASITYADAGSMTLSGRFQGSGEEQGLILNGSSNNFTSLPAGLCVEATESDSDCLSADHNCSVFKQAGEAFSLRVKAVAWQVDGDTDLCVGNQTTPNYQQSAIALGKSLVAPVGGAGGGLGLSTLDFTGADSGVKTVEQTVSEVGVFRFTAVPPANAYFGLTVPAGESVNTGRFIPASFELAHTATPACNATFTYAGHASSKPGQPFMVSGTITARNLAGETTVNYTTASSFARLEANQITATAWTGGSAAPGVLSWQVDSLNFIDGVGTFQENDASYAFNSVAAPQSVYLAVSATDDDGVSGTLSDPARAVLFRFGRLRLSDSHAPDNESLTLPFLVDFFDGTRFKVNTADGCTALSPATHLVLSGNNGSTWLSGDAAVPVGGGTTMAAFGHTPMLAGDTGLTFTAPGRGNTGKVQVRANTSSDFPWLLYDWNGDGAHAELSEATATFGLYRGNKRIINWREIMQ